jgi:hypothetical protein
VDDRVAVWTNWPKIIDWVNDILATNCVERGDVVDMNDFFSRRAVTIHKIKSAYHA